MRAPLIIQLLKQPELAQSFSAAQWQSILAVSRQHKLQASLALQLTGQLLPRAVERQLQSAHRVVAKQQQDLGFELSLLSRHLGDLEPVVLKGGAYALTNKACAKGRLCGDLDLLVTKSRLAEAEKRLLALGWRAEHQAPYDEVFYRRWMHEIPPMIHHRRGTVVDLHHAITPPLGRVAISFDQLAEQLESTPHSKLKVLSQPGMVIHSCVHLLVGGEFGQALRDLWDIYQLVDNERLIDILQLARAWHVTPWVLAVLSCVDLLLEGGYDLPQLDQREQFLRRLILQAIVSACNTPGHDNWTADLLYLYGHRLRLPWPLLIKHLAHKSRLRLKQAQEARHSRAELV